MKKYIVKVVRADDPEWVIKRVIFVGEERKADAEKKREALEKSYSKKNPGRYSVIIEEVES